MTYAVVGCSDCSALWLVGTGERRDRRSPRCGRTYSADSRSRRRLSTHATQAATREAHSRRIAERADAGDVVLADSHTAAVPTTDALPEWLVEAWPYPTTR